MKKVELLFWAVMIIASALVSCRVIEPKGIDKPEFKVIREEGDCHYVAYVLELDEQYETEIEIKGTFETDYRPSLSNDRNIVVIERSKSDGFNFRVKYYAYGVYSDWSYWR